MLIEVSVLSLIRRYRIITITPAKGLYRRALARIALKEEAEAEKDLTEATKLVNDPTILLELERVRATRKASKEREKAKFKKLFS
jgi:peptidyl-prolyl isomerase D